MTLALPRRGVSSPTDQVETTLFRALAVLRGVVLVYAVILNLTRWHEFARPALGWTVVAVMVLWSVFVTWAYDDPRRRRLPLYVADLAVACLALLSTPLVQSQAMMDRHASSMPSFWVMAAVLAWAVAYGWGGGIVAALIVTACDLSIRVEATGTVWGNIFLLVLAASVVGYSAARLREATEARVAAERVAATMEERARLARVVHDGVLQVLALVQRRGLEIGGDVAELGRLAGEQEVALRALVHGDAVSRVAGPVVGPDVDLVERLALRAPAWVLVEDLGESVVVTVRDEGPGIPSGRLEAAVAEGRMGVTGSIRGRLADLGGKAELVTGPGAGTEWELTVPRR